MMLVTGVTLRQRAADRMGAQEAAQYMIQAARALHHAHLLGIVHRDVKPSNMLLPAEDLTRLLLTDFGTAKILGARGPTKTGATIGTPEYMSPEQAEGREVDQRTDIYSLGCTLYEALAGRPPFVGSTPVSVLYQQVHAQPTYIRSYNGSVPRELWNVLRLCLAKRPDDRYPSAERLAEDLQPFAEGLIQPTPAPWRAPVTGRLDVPDRPTNRTLRAQSSDPMASGSPGSSPLPPPYTPSAAPIMPGLSGQTRPPLDRAPDSQPTYGPRQPRTTVRLSDDPGAALFRDQAAAGRPGSGSLSGQNEYGQPGYPPAGYGQGAYGAPSYVPGRNGSAQSGPLNGPSGGYGARTGNSGPLNGQREPGYGGRSATSGPLGSRLSNGPRPSVNSGPLTPGQRPSIHSGPLTPGQRASANSGPLLGEMTTVPRQRVNSGPLIPNDMRRGAPISQPVAGSRAPNSGSPRYSASAPNFRAPSSTAYRSAPSGPMGGQGGGYGTRAGASGPPPRAPRGGALRSSWGMIAAGLVAVLLLSVALALGAAGMGLLAQGHPKAKAQPTATATAISTPTMTATPPPPTATSGPSAQQLLDQQAAAAFSGITVSPDTGLFCGSSQTSGYSSGEPVYVHLCTAGGSMPGPVTVVARSGGQVALTLYSNTYLSSGTDYYRGHTLSPGTYDMLITVQINGQTATAKDIQFSVN